MPTHFESIGFRSGEEATFSYIDQVFRAGQRRHTPRGDLVPWNAGLGPEAWVQLDGMDVVGFVPHYSGESRLEVQLTNELVRDEAFRLDATLQALVKFGASGGDVQEYPLIFDSPDYHLLQPLTFPAARTIQVALFPEQISRFENEDAFIAAQSHRDLKHAARSLIPMGLFGEGPPRSEVFACGVIDKVAERKNPLTSLPFYALLFNTLGGQFDLVLPHSGDAEQVKVGEILAGTFWVSGRVLPAEPPAPAG